MHIMQYGNERVGGAAHVPEGWDWWAGLLGNSKYYNYSLSINGTEKSYGNSPSDYLTDVIVSMQKGALTQFRNNIPYAHISHSSPNYFTS